MPYTAAGPWTPPGIVPPWPADEYLRDGGNAGPPVRVGPNGELLGLEMEDTVARYSTLDGRTLVEPSNKVSLYSPRFNAVRQVVDVEIDQQRNRATGVAEPVKPLAPRTSEPVGLNTQNLQAVRDIGTNPAVQLRSRQSQATLFAELRPKGFDNFYRVYENLAVIRTGVYVGHEEAILAKGTQAAIAWNHKQAVQIYLDSQAAGATVVSQKPQETFAHRLGAQSAAAGDQGRIHAGRRAGRRGLVHDPLRQRGQSAHRQRADCRQPDDAAGVCARQCPVQPEGPVLHAAQRRRVAGRALRAQRAAAAGQGRRLPLPLHRAVVLTRSL